MIKRELAIVGNWKMNKTPTEAKKFFIEFKKLYSNEESKIDKGIRFGFAVPSVNILIASENKVIPKMIVAAETINQNASGAFTGELSTSMIKEVGANAVVIGHSERREYYCETDKDVNEKVKTALAANLMPIMCIGETLDERKSNMWQSIITKQLDLGLKGISDTDMKKIIIAYEPIWAIGTGVTASAAEAQEACKFVRSRIEAQYSKNIAEQVIIQYGGSVKPMNVAELMSQPDIDGALVGGASLEANSFIKLLTLNK